MMPRMLDLFCGRFGWGRVFAERGWEVVGIDLVEPPEIPKGCEFRQADILEMTQTQLYFGKFDFICASSPCEQFSVHGMKHFHPNPPYPELGIKLFNHTRSLCEASGLNYVMENVRAAQQFVGRAVNHAGSFYLLGNAVPPLMPQRISKGFGNMSTAHYHANLERISPHIRAKHTATIPAELAAAVADYAERILEHAETA